MQNRKDKFNEKKISMKNNKRVSNDYVEVKTHANNSVINDKKEIRGQSW